MTRSKKAPSVHKPPFDEEIALRFAEKGLEQEVVKQGRTDVGLDTGKRSAKKPAKDAGSERLSLELLLKPETIVHLRQEADRRGKAVEQIVDKLVAKHLGKH